jgi:hypothetical protein
MRFRKVAREKIAGSDRGRTWIFRGRSAFSATRSSGGSKQPSLVIRRIESTIPGHPEDRSDLPCHPEERSDEGSAPQIVEGQEQILRFAQDDRRRSDGREWQGSQSLRMTGEGEWLTMTKDSDRPQQCW